MAIIAGGIVAVGFAVKKIIKGSLHPALNSYRTAFRYLLWNQIHRQSLRVQSKTLPGSNPFNSSHNISIPSFKQGIYRHRKAGPIQPFNSYLQHRKAFQFV